MIHKTDSKTDANAIVREGKLAKIAALARGMTHEQQEKLIAMLEAMKQNRS